MIKNQFGGSKADTMVKLALIFFICLLSFSVGTFVGKQVSDSERRRAALEDDYKKHRDVASTEEGSDAISKDEVENLAKEFLDAEKHEAKGAHHEAKEEHPKKDAHTTKNTHEKAPDGYKKMGKKEGAHAKPQKEAMKMKKEAHKPKPHKPKPHKETAVKKSATADRVAQGKTPSKDMAKKRKPSSVLPKLGSSSVGKYTVQISSYSTESEAKSHAAELKHKGYSAFYVPANVKGKTWYRVSIGLFDSWKTANYFKKQYSKESTNTSSIVQKIVK